MGGGAGLQAFALPSESDGDGERKERKREEAAWQDGSSSGLAVGVKTPITSRPRNKDTSPFR